MKGAALRQAFSAAAEILVYYIRPADKKEQIMELEGSAIKGASIL